MLRDQHIDSFGDKRMMSVRYWLTKYEVVLLFN